MIVAADYDAQWEGLDDFIAYHPGARHRRRISRRMLATLDFATCLDVGCGNGRLLEELSGARGAAIAATGIDVAPSVLERNKARFPGADFYQLDIERQALDRQFELIVCSEVIEHLANRADAVRHMTAMLKPGGHLLVTCPTGGVHATERHFGHVSHPTLEELRQLARENQLAEIRSLNWGWPTYRILKWATNLRPGWALKTFAGGTYSPAKRLVCAFLYGVNFLNVPDSPRGCQLFVLLRKR